MFLKHFNKQIIHGTLTSLSKKHNSAYRVEDERKVLLSHHLGLTEEMLPLMRINTDCLYVKASFLLRGQMMEQ